MNLVSKIARRILWFEAIGFAAVIAVSWLDELVSFASRIFGGHPSSNWRESILETTVILLAWLMVFLLTRRLLIKLQRLENFWQMYLLHKQVSSHARGQRPKLEVSRR
jgi:cell shape-determining protein MreD